MNGCQGRSSCVFGRHRVAILPATVYRNLLHGRTVTGSGAWAHQTLSVRGSYTWERHRPIHFDCLRSSGCLGNTTPSHSSSQTSPLLCSAYAMPRPVDWCRCSRGMSARAFPCVTAGTEVRFVANDVTPGLIVTKQQPSVAVGATVKGRGNDGHVTIIAGILMPGQLQSTIRIRQLLWVTRTAKKIRSRLDVHAVQVGCRCRISLEKGISVKLDLLADFR
jgi:hypothetical protein